jgi:hypothetical protein
MRFEIPLESQPHGTCTTDMEWIALPETGNTHEELQALESKYRSLQTLVGELLVTNQRLRLEVSQLKKAPNAPATHPPLRPDR